MNKENMDKLEKNLEKRYSNKMNYQMHGSHVNLECQNLLQNNN